MRYHAVTLLNLKVFAIFPDKIKEYPHTQPTADDKLLSATKIGLASMRSMIVLIAMLIYSNIYTLCYFSIRSLYLEKYLAKIIYPEELT